jgi:hypothetical protein
VAKVAIGAGCDATDETLSSLFIFGSFGGGGLFGLGAGRRPSVTISPLFFLVADAYLAGVIHEWLDEVATLGTDVGFGFIFHIT